MKTRRLSNLFSCIAFAFFINEGTGYSAFNAEDGSNFICDIDPTCRKLTEDEIELFKTYYGDLVDYRQINYFERARFGISVGYAAAAIFNGIYEDKAITERYYNKGERKEKLLEATKIHEVGHISQYQNKGVLMYLDSGIQTGLTNLWAMLTSKNFEADIYDIDVETAKWENLTMEQEAEIPFDIHFMRYEINHAVNNISDPKDVPPIIEKCRELTKLEEFAIPHLPIEKTHCPINMDVS